MKRQNVRSLVLVLVMMLYILLGAAIFERLESSNEITGLSVLEGEREVLRSRFNLSESAWEQISDHLVRYMPHRAGLQWKFAGAVYFSTTVITTIGYGHSTPKTNWGKVFCMLYALVGIPLNLVMFQSIGERLNTFNTFLLCGIRKKLTRNRTKLLRNDLCLHKHQNINHENKLKQWSNKRTEIKKDETSRNKVDYYIQINEPPIQTDPYITPKRKVYINLNDDRNCKPLFKKVNSLKEESSQNESLDDLQISMMCEGSDLNDQKDQPNGSIVSTVKDLETLRRASIHDLLSSSFATTKFHLSDTHLIFVTTAFSSIFVAGGAYAFSRFEGWTYLDSLYYCIITLTTVGFGDLVALQNDKEMQVKPAYVALNVFFILAGLAVVSAAMNLLVLRFLTMNTEDEKRDMIKENILNSKMGNFSEDVLSNSQKNVCSNNFSYESSFSREEKPPLWGAVQRLCLIGRHFISEPPSTLMCSPSDIRYPDQHPINFLTHQQHTEPLQIPRYDYLYSEKFPNHLELPSSVNIYHSRSRLLTM